MNYVVLLRGINVGGVKMPMAELKADLTKLGLNSVKTYLASGNVSFSSEKNSQDVKKMIEDMLAARHNYIQEIFIYDDISKIVDKYPFKAEQDKHRYVIFCRNKDVCDRLANEIEDLELDGEPIRKDNDVIFWKVTIGQTLDSKIGKLLSKSSFKSDLTTRNIQTLQKIKSHLEAS